MADLSRAVQHRWKLRSIAAAFFSGRVLGVLLVLRASSARSPRVLATAARKVRRKERGPWGG